MQLLHCKRDSPAVDAATSTVSSESVPIIAAVAASSAAADATPHLHVSPKLADPSCHWKSRSTRKKTTLSLIGMVLVVMVPDTSMCWS